MDVNKPTSRGHSPHDGELPRLQDTPPVGEVRVKAPR
jgi:hypothetical protein